MIEVKNLTVKTRHPILTDFSINFEKGKLYGIVAVNGSGKTTFFRTLMELIPRVSGEIKVNNKSVYHSKKSLFYYESSEWFDTNLSGLDYLKFVKQKWNSDVSIDSVIKYWGMEDYVAIPIKKYSLGMKQRLLISMYIVSDAEYLIMDEITNALDEKNRKLLFDDLVRLVGEGKTVILSSHYKEDVISVCDYLLEIKNETMTVLDL